MSALYFSPMLLGLCLLLAVAIAATALWLVSRPYAGPGFWMAGIWTLIAGILLFIGFMITGSPTLNVLGNAGQLGGEAIFLLGIFRFMGRPLPWWIIPLSVSIMVLFNVHYWVFDGNSDFLMGVYSTIAGLLPLQAIWLLLRAKDDAVTRPARLLVAVSLLIYSLVTLVRGALGYLDWWQQQPYEMPYDSFSYLLPYNFAIPALVMGFVGVTLMTMQRILARSEYHAQAAQRSAQRFERLLSATSSGVAIIRQGLIHDANLRLEQLTGRPRVELIGQAVSLLFAENSQAKLHNSLQLGATRQLELQALHQQHGGFTAEISLEPLEQQGDHILELRDISHHKALEARLHSLATRDPLTGILNRRAFDDAIQPELARCERQGHALSLALLDIDHFKQFNDRHGHAVGDLVLQAFTHCCQTHLRASDRLARFGGEEFIIMLVDTDSHSAMQLMQRLRQSVHQLQPGSVSNQLMVRFSAGITQWQPGDTLDSLVRRADRGLYQAKNAGRDQIHCWPPATETFNHADS
ncbi:GGDEF domain-containing protein [Halopseudomonas salegens]|uniref:diguanylate cyclase n=1 Tax=Halopseudomonas salegens TaxID=1434072 RepID=A0A1H2HPG5_9GAMM|nr:GGDEF domain-containing protein [Halopseudomonas salegens]SDU33727.1 PAS domain S-box-containing protein/diguanylate cyclase (GGDEF) domain-containing protein [Halopseudomonas salegens]